MVVNNAPLGVKIVYQDGMTSAISSNAPVEVSKGAAEVDTNALFIKVFHGIKGILENGPMPEAEFIEEIKRRFPYDNPIIIKRLCFSHHTCAYDKDGLIEFTAGDFDPNDA